MKRAIQLLLLSSALPLASVQTTDASALAAATHDLCPVQIAMLGESNTHGDGHTEAFKVALVKRLIDECHFDSVYFEANHAEFLNLNHRLRAKQPINADDISNAIGGLWKFDKEFKPLVPFLLAKAQTGQIDLAGLDDQLGQMGQDYANVTMVTELMSLLPEPQRQPCTEALHRRIYSDYTDATPYTQADDIQITTCLTASQTALAADNSIDPTTQEDRRELLASTQRWIGRGIAHDAAQFSGRDHSMFQTFEWLIHHQPQRHKVIVWAATIHIAKQADPTGHSNNFGSYIHQQYGAHAFSLGFAALTGTYREGRHDAHAIPTAPPDSLEAKALQGTNADAVYISASKLLTMGTIPAAIISHTYQTVPLSSLVDGVVVFREERAKD
jgi:erythromycin esterase-like protein